MAVIPRYVSESNATPAINTARIDPNLAAAPYKAAEQSSAQVMSVVQHELGAWGQVLAQKQKEQKAAAEKQAKIQEGLYQAEAGARLAISANQIQHKALAGHTGDISATVNGADQQYQQLVDQLVAGAPSDAAKMMLIKKAIGARASLYNNVTNTAMKQSNQMNMDKIESLLKQSEGLAASDPNSIEVIREGTKDIFASMSSLGIPQAQRDEIARKFNMNLDYSAIRSRIEQDPITAAQELHNGKYSFLGSNQVRSLHETIKSRSNAILKLADLDIQGIQDRLIAGLPVDESAAAKIQQASRYGLQDKVATVDRLMKLSQDAGTLPADELEASAARLKIEAAQGKFSTSPAEIKTLTKFLEGNAKALREDPIQYAQVRGNINELAPIDDLKNISPSQLEERKLRALQIKELYLVEAPMLSKAETNLIANKMANSDVETLVSNFQVTSQFDRSSRQALVKSLEKAKPAVAALLNNPAVDRATTDAIIRGEGMLKSGGTKITNNLESPEELDSIYLDRPELRKGLISAAKALAAHDKDTDLTEDHIMRAGNLIKMNSGWFSSGSKYFAVAPKANMTADDFTKFLDSNLNSADPWINNGTGVPANTEDGTPVNFHNLPPSSFQYFYDSDGMYSVMYKNKQVTTAEGKPVRIDLQDLARK